MAKYVPVITKDEFKRLVRSSTNGGDESASTTDCAAAGPTTVFKKGGNIFRCVFDTEAKVGDVDGDPTTDTTRDVSCDGPINQLTVGFHVYTENTYDVISRFIVQFVPPHAGDAGDPAAPAVALSLDDAPTDAAPKEAAAEPVNPSPTPDAATAVGAVDAAAPAAVLSLDATTTDAVDDADSVVVGLTTSDDLGVMT